MTSGTEEDTRAPGRDQEPSRRSVRGRWSRALLVVGAVLLLVAGVVVGVLVSGGDDEPGAVAQTPDPNPSPAGEWMSGAAGEGVLTGEYAAWRGRPIDIVGGWADNNEAMVELWLLQDGFDYDSWSGPFDVAIGAISRSESWEEAATGAYEQRWRQSLTNLRELWGDRPGTVYIRFAHEMNGDWYPWSVTEENAEAFVESWRLFRGLQEEIFPEAQLVFCVGRESIGLEIDWRQIFPGREYVDVMGVDYYNMYPAVETAEEWTATLLDYDDSGGPKGLERHREFAESVGLPLAVPEWSGDARFSDSPAFIEGMYEFFSANAGDGPGEVLYEIQFNVDRNDRQWLLYGENTRMPESAATYQRLW